MKYVVLTGGPCAGKTSVFDALRLLLPIPFAGAREAATEIFKQRPTPTPEWTLEDWRELQRAITYQQLRHEQWARQKSFRRHTDLIICDRAPYDNRAYPEGEAMIAAFDYTRQILSLNSYSLVIHLQSLAVANPRAYSSLSNASRYESLEQAVAQNEATLAAWADHPNRVILANTGTLDETIEERVRLIMQLMTD